MPSKTTASLAGPPADMREKLAAEIKMMLHASRDCMRNQFHAQITIRGPNKFGFVCSDGYYSEAFGILRAMHIAGWGEFGAVNVAGTLDYWFSGLCQEVLKEENFAGSNECDWCLSHYGRDGAGRKK